MAIIIMILLLSFLVLIHELGHFLAAKAFGIKVEKFGFGLPFGPTLLEKKIGDTTFLVHALLLGGYVAFPDDEKDCDLPEDSPERFENKPVYQRAIVVSAGVIANVICAFFLVLFSALVWKYLPSGVYNIEIAKILAPKDASVWSSGLKVNDRIVSVNGKKPYFYIIRIKIHFFAVILPCTGREPQTGSTITWRASSARAYPLWSL